MATTQVNKQFSLSTRDLLRGLLIAVLTAVLTTLAEMIKQGWDAIEWEEVLLFGAGAGISYLLKNFLTPTEVVVVNPPPQVVDAAKTASTVHVDDKMVTVNKTP